VVTLPPLHDGLAVTELTVRLTVVRFFGMLVTLMRHRPDTLDVQLFVVAWFPLPWTTLTLMAALATALPDESWTVILNWALQLSLHGLDGHAVVGNIEVMMVCETVVVVGAVVELVPTVVAVVLLVGTDDVVVLVVVVGSVGSGAMVVVVDPVVLVATDPSQGSAPSGTTNDVSISSPVASVAASMLPTTPTTMAAKISAYSGSAAPRSRQATPCLRLTRNSSKQGPRQKIHRSHRPTAPIATGRATHCARQNALFTLSPPRF
jgi:hypothetical protein